MTWIKIASTDEIKNVSELQEIVVSEESLVLFHIDKDYVTSNLCTHRKEFLKHKAGRNFDEL